MSRSSNHVERGTAARDPHDSAESPALAVDPGPASTARRVRRRRRSRSRRRWLARRAPALAVVSLVLLVLLVWVGVQALNTWRAYSATRQDVADLRAFVDRPGSSLDAASLSQVQGDLVSLEHNLARLADLTRMPVLTPIVSSLPWIGPRYDAALHLIDMGRYLSGAGVEGVAVAREASRAYETTGLTTAAGTDAPQTAPTWLEVVEQRQEQLRSAASLTAQARAERQVIDTGLLPGSLREDVERLDRTVFDQDLEGFIEQDFDALLAALGGEGPIRYLVLFQNPAELRPAGGFPGVVALVTFERGRLESLEFYNVSDLTIEYMERRSERLPQPWPIERYWTQDGFLLHDATWWADFPRSATQLMAMYAETGRPEISGVVAVAPATVQDVLQVTGPLTVDFEEQSKRITAENYYREIESLRGVTVKGLESTDPPHKELTRLIGQALIERVRQGSRGTQLAVARSLANSAANRDIQLYSEIPVVQQALEQRNWAGSLIPEPGIVTLGVTFANFGGGKSSLRVEPRFELTLSQGSTGTFQGRLEVNITNTGTNEDDPFYGGFQRWWVEVLLPDGSSVVRADPAPEGAPDALNGGGYLLDTFRQQTRTLVVEFEMPEVADILFRRQPGLPTGELTLQPPNCDVPVRVATSSDVLVHLDQLCDAQGVNDSGAERTP